LTLLFQCVERGNTVSTKIVADSQKKLKTEKTEKTENTEKKAKSVKGNILIKSGNDERPIAVTQNSSKIVLISQDYQDKVIPDEVWVANLVERDRFIIAFPLYKADIKYRIADIKGNDLIIGISHGVNEHLRKISFEDPDFENKIMNYRYKFNTGFTDLHIESDIDMGVQAESLNLYQTWLSSKETRQKSYITLRSQLDNPLINRVLQTVGITDEEVNEILSMDQVALTNVLLFAIWKKLEDKSNV
jgi:hypothetical protein